MPFRRLAPGWVILLAIASPVAATVTVYPLPTSGAEAAFITLGPDGNLWFGESGPGNIGRITPAGGITEFTLPNSGNSTPAGIAAGVDGNLWFADATNNTMGMITPGGIVTQYPLHTQGALPAPVVQGADGAIWFAEAQYNNLAWISPFGDVVEYHLPATNDVAGGILALAAAPDKSIWFTENHANRVGRVTVTGQFTEFDLPTASAQPGGIAIGSDGNAWFTESIDGGNARIARITPAGVVTEFPIIADASSAVSIINGPDGALWFSWSTSSYAKIGRITTAGAMTQFDLPTGTTAAGLAFGADGALWFTDFNGNAVGRMPIPGGGGGGVCVPDATTLCIDDRTGDRRFEVKVAYQTSQGGGLSGQGNAIPLSTLGVTHGGLFWFFGSDNPEMLIKVLNGCGIDGKYWVYYAAGTNVGLTTTVRDTVTGHTKTYANPDLTAAAPVQDTAALACSSADLAAAKDVPPPAPPRGLDPELAGWMEARAKAAPVAENFPVTAVGSSSIIQCGWICFGDATCSGTGTVTLDRAVSPPFFVQNLRLHSGGPPQTLADCTGTPVSFPAALGSHQVLLMDFRFSPTSPGTLTDTMVTSGAEWDFSGVATGGGGGSCVPNATTLCLDDRPGDRRFEVQVAYHTSQGGGLSGQGNAIPLAGLGVTHGGLFWFFGSDNPEMLIKVLNGCGINHQYWVYYAAGTNVGLQTTVTDTVTGHSRVYTNADLTPAPPVQDTSALACN